MRQSEAGFSMIELLIAMTVFSFMLLIVSVAFINIVRIQQAGVSSRAVQQNSRLVLDQIVATARQSSEAIIPTSGQSRVCFQTGNGVIEYKLTLALDIVSDRTDRLCGEIPDTSQQLNDSSVEFVQLVSDATGPVGISAGTYRVTLLAASRNNVDAGAINLLSSPPSCNPGPGSQFCSVITVTSTAALKGGI